MFVPGDLCRFDVEVVVRSRSGLGSRADEHRLGRDWWLSQVGSIVMVIDCDEKHVCFFDSRGWCGYVLCERLKRCETDA